VFEEELGEERYSKRTTLLKTRALTDYLRLLQSP